MSIEEALQKAQAGDILSAGEALGVLDAPDEGLPQILAAAFALRQKFHGRKVSVQILSNARSGNCSQDCAYCAQAATSTASIEKYRQLPYERLSLTGQAAESHNLSRHCIGLSGIRFSDREIGEFAAQVRRLKAESPLPICCSIGFLSEEQARVLKEAGVDRINHNLNTSRAFYPRICTTHTYDERLANIAMLQGMGFEICSGGIVGLGESRKDVVDMLLELVRIRPQAVPINFLIPLEGSRLEKADVSALTPCYCLKVVCLARLLLQGASIRCAAGREVYFQGREQELFQAVDSIFASGYLTADGQSIDDTIKLVEDTGFEFSLE